METAAEALSVLKEHRINTTERLKDTMEHYEVLKKMENQTLYNINDPLEPLKISAALRSEYIKLDYRKQCDPKSINILDYTVIAALKEALEKRVKDNGQNNSLH